MTIETTIEALYIDYLWAVITRLVRLEPLAGGRVRATFVDPPPRPETLPEVDEDEGRTVIVVMPDEETQELEPIETESEAA